MKFKEWLVEIKDYEADWETDKSHIMFNPTAKPTPNTPIKRRKSDFHSNWENDPEIAITKQATDEHEWKNLDLNTKVDELTANLKDFMTAVQNGFQNLENRINNMQGNPNSPASALNFPKKPVSSASGDLTRIR